MTSPKQLQHYAIEKILHATVKFSSRQGLSAKALRHLLDTASHIFPKSNTLQIKQLQLAGMHCEEIKVPQQDATQLVFYIHGGAFFVGGLDSHRGLACDLVNYTNAQVLHFNYPLAPEHVFPNALERLYCAYLELIEQGMQPKDITIAGDSCGGNLALALCLKLRDNKQPLPSGLILLSPWLDLSLSGESIELNKKHDALLCKQLLIQGLTYYISDDICIDDTYVSPLFANLKGLPEMLIQVGSKEILLDDARRLKKFADEAGIKATLSIFPGMWHNFHLFNHWVKPAKQALFDIAKFIDHVDH